MGPLTPPARLPIVCRMIGFNVVSDICREIIR
jgi:hypothetical protein